MGAWYCIAALALGLDASAQTARPGRAMPQGMTAPSGFVPAAASGEAPALPPAVPAPRLPAAPGLCQRIIAATDQMLTVGSWGPVALRMYRLVGLEEEDIARRVAALLDRYLAYGRTHGLSDGFENPMFPDIPRPQAGGALLTPQRLAEYRAYLDRLGQRRSIDHLFYGTGLEDAFRLAAETNNRARMSEIFIHMLRVRDYDGAYKSAYAAGRDDLLIHVGLIALMDYRLGHHENYLSEAIEALKRVQGEFKPTAARLLLELARWLTSPEHVGAVAAGGDHAEARARLAFHALRALRSTGRLVREWAIDSAHVDFVTVVEDPEAAQALRELASEAEGLPMSSGFWPDERVMAWRALGDAAALAARMRREIRTGRFHLSDEDHEVLASLGDPALLREAADALLAGRGRNPFLPYGPHMDAARLYAAARDREGLLRVRRILAEDGLSLPPDEEEALQALERLEPQAARAEPAPVDPMEAELAYFRAEIEKRRAALTPELRAAAIARGDGLLGRGRAFEAYRAYLDGLHVEGLIAAGDRMLEGGDGLNARTPYLFAALLGGRAP